MPRDGQLARLGANAGLRRRLPFVAAARSVFTVTRKQDDPDQRVFAPAKNNLWQDVGALAFLIEQRITGDNIIAPYTAFAQANFIKRTVT